MSVCGCGGGGGGNEGEGSSHMLTSDRTTLWVLV